MFMTIIWNTKYGAEVQHLTNTTWFDASKFLIDNGIEFKDLKCVEVEDAENHDAFVIINEFEK